MKKNYFLVFAAFVCLNLSGFGQGSESFTLCNATPSYTDGSYVGDNGVTWTYVHSRNDAGFQIIDEGILLRRVSDGSRITSASVPNGIGNFTCQLLKGFTGSGNRQVELFINGVSQGTSMAWDNDTVQTFTVNAINIIGNVSIEIKNITDHQVVIDNISWTASSTTTVDYCNLEFPQNGNITVGTPFNVYAQVYEAGVTEATGPSTEITGWIGYNTINNEPNSPSWTWVPATFNAQVDNNDEYVANISATLPSGTYYYASRFQTSGGPYRYGGYNETGGGFWDGASNISGVLSVDTVDFCNLQYPGFGTINLGDAFDVYGQVYEQGNTPGLGQGPGIVAEIGYSTTNSNPSTWSNWIPANYNGDCLDCNYGENDEYSANLGVAITFPGTYYYATRFRLNSGIWLYGGILADGSAGYFWDGTTYISGVLNVMAPEIRVEGNLGTFPEIVSGDTTPQGTDNTLFAAQYIGASQSKSYRIRNIGNLDLTVSSVNIEGANPGDFTVNIFPVSTILPAMFSLLEIEFSPLASGVRNATVSIVNNDSDENPYTFAIRGTGLCVATSYNINPVSGPAGTIATITGTNFDALTLGSINGIPMATSLINSTTIEVTIPADASTGNIVVMNNIGCTSTIPFTVIDNKIGGCEGTTSLSDLIISEITDATLGGLTYIEVYNGTGSTINLEDYSIGVYSNGSASASSTIALHTFNLANNATYVIAIGVAGNPSNSNTCPQAGGNGQFANQSSGVSGINKKDNEHDVIRLLKSGGTIIVDQFGEYMDNTWMDATIITGDRGFNFRRLNTALLLPNPNFDLNDWTIIDWIGAGAMSCSTNDYSDIGFFDYSGAPSPTVTLQPTAPTSICYLTATLTISATEGIAGGFPLAYQWYFNAPGTSNWIEILDSDPMYSGQQSHTLNIINTLDLDGFQYYAQIRENTGTCFTASNTIRIKVEKTTWDGFSWNPEMPNSGKVAIINGDYTTNPSSGSFTACSLIVNSGHTLNVSESYFVEIINDVIVNGNSSVDFGQIVVESQGAFVQRGDGTDAGIFKLNNTALARVNKLTASKQRWYDYTYWGSPVTNETVETVLSMASASRRFYYEATNYEDTNGDDVDDNGDDWQLATGKMIPGVGYASTSKASGVFPRIDSTVFNGAFNNGDISVPIYANNTTTWKDWNFIGNPYASAIDFNSVYDENTSVIAGAAYLWSQASPPLASNPGNQVLNFNRNDYAIICTGSGNIAGGKPGIPSDLIPSGQGFFVIGINNGGTLTFKNSMRMAEENSNSIFYKNDTPVSPNKFWINLTSDNGVFNQILVAYVEGATNGFDGFTYDIERNLASGINAIIYTEIPGSNKKYAIQGKAINSITLQEEVALGFKTSIEQPTIYKLSIAQVQGYFFDDHNIYLKDHHLNVYHNLSSADYNFTSETGNFKDRFVILFKHQTLSAGEIVLDSKDLTIIELNNGQVQFSVGHNLSIKSVKIKDILGRSLYHLIGSNATEVYDLSNLSQATYIAKVKLCNGQTITKRSIKRQ